MFDLGAGELALILLVVLVLFGPKKLPDLAQSIGKGLRQFRQAQKDFSDQINHAMREEERKKPATNLGPGNTIARGVTPGGPARSEEASEEQSTSPRDDNSSSSNQSGDGDLRRTEESPESRRD